MINETIISKTILKNLRSENMLAAAEAYIQSGQDFFRPYLRLPNSSEKLMLRLYVLAATPFAGEHGLDYLAYRLPRTDYNPTPALRAITELGRATRDGDHYTAMKHVERIRNYAPSIDRIALFEVLEPLVSDETPDAAQMQKLRGLL